MPPTIVRTIHEEILYEYAKLISRSDHGGLEREFIVDRFRKLRGGEIDFAAMMDEWEKNHELPQECVFCGSKENLTTEYLVPKTRGGDDSPDNVVLACQRCNAERGDRGVFEWLGLKRKDRLHRLVAGRYLKQLMKTHEAAGTLYTAKSDIGHLCANCPLPDVCAHWDTVGKLSCFCLESVLPRK